MSADVAENSHASTSTLESNSEDVVTEEQNQGQDSKPAMAVKQIEFYFADANLPFDKFMWGLYTANEEHWVPISTVSSFKRMKEFISLGVEGIAKALRELSQDLEVDDTGTQIRRKHEVQEPKDRFERSIYAKGFGTEEPELQQKLEIFFNNYGQTNAVRMRRMDQTREFKGSVFVEFSDFKTVKAFLEADPKPTWNGSELLIMTKEAYCDMKIKEKGLTGRAAVSRKDSITNRKGFNAFREMAKDKKGAFQDKNQGGGSKEKTKPEIWLEFMGNKIRVHEENGTGIVLREDVVFVKSGTLKFAGSGSDVKFDQIKDPLRERFSRVPYIQYNAGDDWGLLGFDKSLTEEEITFVKETLKTIDGKNVEWTIPSEQEEKEFQYSRANFAAGRVYGASQARSAGGKGGRGGGKGGRGRGGGRGGRGGRKPRASNPASTDGGGEQVGEKRKRAVEPDGGPDVGSRGQAIPLVRTTSKKAKTDGSDT